MLVSDVDLVRCLFTNTNSGHIRFALSTVRPVIFLLHRKYHSNPHAFIVFAHAATNGRGRGYGGDFLARTRAI
jgi:hypothetical protein